MKIYLVQSVELINTSNGKEGQQHLITGTQTNSQGRIFSTTCPVLCFTYMRNDAPSTAGPAQPVLQSSKQKHTQLQSNFSSKHQLSSETTACCNAAPHSALHHLSSPHHANCAPLRPDLFLGGAI